MGKCLLVPTWEVANWAYAYPPPRPLFGLLETINIFGCTDVGLRLPLVPSLLFTLTGEKLAVPILVCACSPLSSRFLGR